jgi:NAD(P)-dependent dehydrogenase (short-subunit alcohol dehydrogenase family)
MAYSGLDISGKVCLVTGGVQGLGNTIAMGMASAGAKIVVADINPAKFDAVKAQLGTGHDAVQLDVCDAKSCAAVVDSVVKKFGRIDAVLNAAGILKRQPSLEMPPEDFEKIIKVNLVGNFTIAQAAGRVMKDQEPDAHGCRGSLVNIASLNSFVNLNEVLAYACSKCGVLGLTRGLANEWAKYGIRVNAIAPGVFVTDLNRAMLEGTPRGQFLRAHTPMDRFGQAEELIGAVIYLISPAASYTTGETIIVDGGFLTRGV